MPKSDDFDVFFFKASPAAEQVEEWARRSGRRRAKPRWRPSKIKVFKRELKDMLALKRWDGLAPGHLVALYCLCFERVYETTAVDVDGEAYPQAALAAERLAEEQFGGDLEEVARFMSWCWKREVGRERWRRENKKDGGTIGWRLQFSAKMVPEYRISIHRREHGDLS